MLSTVAHRRVRAPRLKKRADELKLVDRAQRMRVAGDGQGLVPSGGGAFWFGGVRQGACHEGQEVAAVSARDLLVVQMLTVKIDCLPRPPSLAVADSRLHR